MKVDIFWLVVIVIAVGFVVWRLSALAGRIDRLHHRIDLARGSLDAQLIRRARAAEAVAASGLIDPASSIVLAQAASNSRNADPEDPGERGIVESEMSRDLREVFADPEAVAELCALPEGQELVGDLAAACSAVVRLFRLAGHAPMPQTVEMDDEVPPALVAHA